MKIILKDFNHKGRHYDYFSIKIGKKDKMGRKMFKRILKLMFKYDSIAFKED